MSDIIEPGAGGNGQGHLLEPMPADGEVKQTAVNLRPGSWLEVFFDLVFAAAITQVAQILHRNPTLAGFGRFAVLFVVIW